MSYIPAGWVAVLKPSIDKVSLTYKLPSYDTDLKPAVIEGLLLEAERAQDNSRLALLLHDIPRLEILT